MAIPVLDMIEDVRIESGLRNNRLFSNQKIVDRLNDAFAALRDLLIARFAYWFKAPDFDFTLAGGDGGNVLDLVANVPDLEMIQGLFLRVGNNLQRVDLMSSVQEIGQLNSSFMTVGSDWSYSGFSGRKYFPDGDNLYIYPAANASGDYRLIYTPQQKTLALPALERTFAVSGGDQPGTVGPGPSNAWLLGAAQFVAEDVGRTLIPAFATPNEAWNIPFLITEFFSSTAVAVTPNPNAIGVFDTPPSGTWSVYSLPDGSIGSLPQQLTQWKRYLILYASIVIRQSRRQPMGDLELQFQQIEARIKSIAKQRSEGVRQAPILRGFRGSNNGGFGY